MSKSVTEKPQSMAPLHVVMGAMGYNSLLSIEEAESTASDTLLLDESNSVVSLNNDEGTDPLRDDNTIISFDEDRNTSMLQFLGMKSSEYTTTSTYSKENRDKISELDCRIENTTPLFETLRRCKWQQALSFLKSDEFHQRESSEEKPCGLGEPGQATPAEQAKTWVSMFRHNQELLWRRLPIHDALIRSAPLDIIIALLEIYPEGIQCRDSNGNLPLHLAMKHDREALLVEKIIQQNPLALDVMNEEGKKPIQCVRWSDAVSFSTRAMMLQRYTDFASASARKTAQSQTNKNYQQQQQQQQQQEEERDEKVVEQDASLANQTKQGRQQDEQENPRENKDMLNVDEHQDQDQSQPNTKGEEKQGERDVAHSGTPNISFPQLEEKMTEMNLAIEAAQSELRLAREELRLIREKEKIQKEQKNHEEASMKEEVMRLRKELEALRLEKEKAQFSNTVSSKSTQENPGQDIEHANVEETLSEESESSDTETSWIASEYTKMVSELEFTNGFKRRKGQFTGSLTAASPSSTYFPFPLKRGSHSYQKTEAEDATAEATEQASSESRGRPFDPTVDNAAGRRAALVKTKGSYLSSSHQGSLIEPLRHIDDTCTSPTYSEEQDEFVYNHISPGNKIEDSANLERQHRRSHLVATNSKSQENLFHLEVDLKNEAGSGTRKNKQFINCTSGASFIGEHSQSAPDNNEAEVESTHCSDRRIASSEDEQPAKYNSQMTAFESSTTSSIHKQPLEVMVKGGFHSITDQEKFNASIVDDRVCLIVDKSHVNQSKRIVKLPPSVPHIGAFGPMTRRDTKQQQTQPKKSFIEEEMQEARSNLGSPQYQYNGRFNSRDRKETHRESHHKANGQGHYGYVSTRGRSLPENKRGRGILNKEKFCVESRDSERKLGEYLERTGYVTRRKAGHFEAEPPTHYGRKSRMGELLINRQRKDIVTLRNATCMADDLTEEESIVGEKRRQYAKERRYCRNSDHDRSSVRDAAVRKTGSVTFAKEAEVFVETRDDDQDAFSPRFSQFDQAVDRAMNKIARRTSALRSQSRYARGRHSQHNKSRSGRKLGPKRGERNIYVTTEDKVEILIPDTHRELDTTRSISSYKTDGSSQRASSYGHNETDRRESSGYSSVF